jgi:hypothetical protein
MNSPNNFISKRIAFTRFRKKIPFLRLIPDEAYYMLDPSDWYEPFGEIETYRLHLEKTYSCYVMTYKECKKDIPREQWLHTRLEEAHLSEVQWFRFTDEMDKYKDMGIQLIPYAKPLKLVPLKDVLRHPCDPLEDYDENNFAGINPDDIPF